MATTGLNVTGLLASASFQEAKAAAEVRGVLFERAWSLKGLLCPGSSAFTLDHVWRVC